MFDLLLQRFLIHTESLHPSYPFCVIVPIVS